MSSDATGAASVVERAPAAPAKHLNVFERYLTLWVAACMAVGVIGGKLFPGVIAVVRDIEFGRGSQINLPIAVLIWLMIYPMMLKVDLSSVLGVRKRVRGVLITCS
jgi:ACR3 family arsenite transporter